MLALATAGGCASGDEPIGSPQQNASVAPPATTMNPASQTTMFPTSNNSLPGMGSLQGAAGAGGGLDVGTTPPTTTATTTGWCDAQPIFASNCTSCHGEQLNFGAPMPLLTYADLHAPLPSDHSKQVYEGVAMRVHSTQSPMPPISTGNKLSADTLSKLDAWIAEGAPMGATTTCATVPTDMTTPTAMDPKPSQLDPGALDADGWPVDCGEHYQFLSGGDAGPQVIQAGQEFYANSSIPAPWGAGEQQALMFKPVLDNLTVLHHYILYAQDGSFITGWAPGNDAGAMPAGVGMDMPAGTYRLEVHYNNTAPGSKMEQDRSGIEMCVASTPRPNTAAVHWLGSLFIAIGPGATQDVTSTCVPNITNGPVHIVSISPHMHQLGVHSRVVLHRASGEDVVLHDGPFAFAEQQLYPMPEDGSAPDVLVNPGDSIESTCTFQNDTQNLVTFGERTSDEMCFFFTTAWPMGQLVNGSLSPDGGSSSSCM